jgi:hypothetical protein
MDSLIWHFGLPEILAVLAIVALLYVVQMLRRRSP